MRRVPYAALGAAALLGLSACGGERAASSSADTTSQGERVFREGACGSCHTLAAAGSRSEIGPDLDARRYTRRQVERALRRGAAGMPAYEPRFGDSEIEAVSRYVARQGARHDR